MHDPRVELVHGEGRHVLSTRAGPFDVIQLSGVDSVSGTPAAAHVFSENYLYSAEAFDLYLARLAPDGIVNMMRQEYVPPREMLKALVTAVAALRRAGVAHPREHVITVTATNGLFTALLVKKTPFTAEEERKVTGLGRREPVLPRCPPPRAAPGRPTPTAPTWRLDDPRREAAFARRLPVRHPARGGRPAVLLPLLVLVAPLLARTRSCWPACRSWTTACCCCSRPPASARPPASTCRCAAWPAAGLRAPAAGRYAAYFAAIGLGYMAIEMALIQKFGLFMGHPNYALSVVLAALLLATGLGALFAGRLAGPPARQRFVSYALAAWSWPSTCCSCPRLHALVGLPFAARVAIVFALVLPIGVCLGTFFPTGLDRLKDEARTSCRGPGASTASSRWWRRSSAWRCR